MRKANIGRSNLDTDKRTLFTKTAERVPIEATSEHRGVLRSCVEDDLKTEGKDARHTLLPSLEEERIEQLDGVTFRLTSSTGSQVAPQPAFYCCTRVGSQSR